MDEVPLLKQLGARVRRRRQELGLTQSQLADQDLTKSSVSQIERGQMWPSLPTLYRLADRLQLRAADLLLTAEEEAARMEAWATLLRAVTSQDVPPQPKASLLTALTRLALVDGLPLPDDQIWNEVAYTLTASGDRKVAGTMLAAYGRILKKRHDPRASDILLRAAELLSVEERTMESS